MLLVKVVSKRVPKGTTFELEFLLNLPEDTQTFSRGQLMPPQRGFICIKMNPYIGLHNPTEMLIL